MTEDQIPEFVEAVLATGCEMCAIGTTAYVFGDADLTREHQDRIADELNRIDDYFGDREHLRFEIIAYLRSIGRKEELPTLH